MSAKRTIESQATQILSLEATLAARPLLPSDAPEQEKDKLIDDLRRTVRELEIVTQGYEENLGAPLRAVKEDVEQEWIPRVESLEATVSEKSLYIEELEKALEREKQVGLEFNVTSIADWEFVGTHQSRAGKARSGRVRPRDRPPDLCQVRVINTKLRRSIIQAYTIPSGRTREPLAKSGSPRFSVYVPICPKIFHHFLVRSLAIEKV